MLPSSFPSLSTTSTEKQYLAYPAGHIARIEASFQQIEAVSNDESIKTVMINLDDAEALLRRGIDSSCFRDDKQVITTSTINDNILPLYHLEKEAEIVSNFMPTFHIPSDKPVYLSQSKNERLWNIQCQVNDTINLRILLNNTPVMLIPLLKGINYEEILASYLPMRREGFAAFSYYAAQYFGNGRGNFRNVLLKDVKLISQLPSLAYLLLIGVESRNLLGRMPEIVKAHAGNRYIRENCWRKPVPDFHRQADLFKFQFNDASSNIKSAERDSFEQEGS
jgi:hypothetical protein